MAPSISVGLALLNFPHSVAEEDASCLLQKTLISQEDIVAVEDECRCPGYYQEECEDEFDQGCRWSDEGSSNGHWCQCLGPDVRQLPQEPPVTASPNTGLPVGVVDSAVQNTKCPHNHEDRLFRTPPGSGSSDITIVDCYEQCLSTPGCNHFSYGGHGGAFVCMGCTTSDEAQTHEGFTLYDMPTHYLTVVSWPVWAWGEWNNDAKGAIEKCSPRDTTADADGTGYWFTSCCTAEGSGLQRDCGTTHNTNFETAVEQCAAQGGRLCTADEVVSLDNRGRMTTATQGCSVDGPRTATGGDLNRLWTSTPCSP